MNGLAVVAAVVAVVIAAAVAFAIGRSTASETSATTEKSEELVVRVGDQLHVPAVDLFCTASFEIDRPFLLCNRTGARARYQVAFERDRTRIGLLGFPGEEQTFLETP